MRAVRRQVSFSTAALMLVASCGSFGSDTGKPPGSSSGDADASTADGSIGDGGSGTPFCPKTGALRCEDFDGVQLSPGWQIDDEPGQNVVIAEDVAGAPSGPRCLHATAEAVADGTDGGTRRSDAYIWARTAVPESTLRLEAKIRLVDAPARGTHVLEIQDDSGATSIRIRADGEVEESIHAGDADSWDDTLANVDLQKDKWMTLVLQIDTAAHTGTVSVDGNQVPFAIDATWKKSFFDARVGFVNASSEDRWEAYYDDVLVTRE